MIWFRKKRSDEKVVSACDLSCRAETELERIRAEMLRGAWRR